MRRTPAAARSRGSGSRLHLRDRRIARRGGWTSAQAREKRHEHAWSGDQEDGEALRQLRERRMDADELQARGSGAERAEDDGRGGRPQRRSAPHQRDRDAIEAVTGTENARVLVLGSKNEQGAAEAGQRAGEDHSLADPAGRGNSARASGLTACSDRSPLESAPGPRQQPPHAGSGKQRERKPEVEPAARKQARQPRGGGDRFSPGHADGCARSGGTQGTRNEPTVDEMNGDPVEQDRADHLVNAATYLEPSREQPPKPAGRCRGGKAPEHRSRDVDLPHDRGGEPAPDELSLGADVEEPDGEGHGYRKPGENQDRALDGRLAQRPGASEGTGEQIAESCDCVSSGNRDGEEAGEKRDEERGDRTPEWIARRREEAAAKLRQPPAPDPASSARAARRWHPVLPRRRCAHRTARGCGGRARAARRDRGKRRGRPPRLPAP